MRLVPIDTVMAFVYAIGVVLFGIAGVCSVFASGRRRKEFEAPAPRAETQHSYEGDLANLAGALGESSNAVGERREPADVHNTLPSA